MGNMATRLIAMAILTVAIGCEGAPPTPRPSPTFSPTRSPSAIADAPPCNRDQIVLLPRWGAALGSYGGSWRFLNVGRNPCSFRAVASAIVLGRTGRTMLMSTPVGRSASLVVVLPGTMAEANVLWSNWCEGDANVIIRVALPNRGGTLDSLPPGRPPCMDRKGVSVLSIEAFTSLAPIRDGRSRVIPVQQAPTEVAASNDAIWITGQDRLIRLDPDGRLVAALNLQFVDGAFIGGGSAVAIGEGAVWVTCACSSEPDPRYGATTGGVVRIDPHRNIHTAVAIFTDRTPGQILASNGAVWVTTGDTITRLSTDDLAVEATIRVPAGFLASGTKRIWALIEWEGEPSLAKIDPSSNRVVSQWRLPDVPSGLVEAFGSLWVIARTSSQLLRIDPSSGESRRVQGHPMASPDFIAAADGSIWMASSSSGTLVRIDPRSESVLETYEIGATDFDALAMNDSTIWVVNYLHWTATRVEV